MAIKITRHPEKIVLLGVPTSAAAMERGHERAPAALRAAEIVNPGSRVPEANGHSDSHANGHANGHAHGHSHGPSHGGDHPHTH